ncbi:MAG TPA: heavy metal-responsive transcriptional regulator [Gammaproteobacteria bacterium]|nr:heavy metal-responsive transcriptional regulator [Gammaproteobacteria bacterium]
MCNPCMVDPDNSLTVGALARRAGLSAEALRRYERLGLLSARRGRSSNYRLYGPGAVRRLHFIQRAQSLGFSLEEIRELLSLHARAGASATEAKALADRRLKEIEGRIRDLERMRAGLAALAHECDGEGPVGECPILAALAEAEPR